MNWYTLCFLRKKEEVLLLNRQKNPWMGRWNGVGGKIEKNETPEECAIREIYEETTIQLTSKDLFYGGQMEWFEDGKLTGGLELYLIDLPDDYHYPTPIATREGILDFKTLDWVLHPENKGMPDNIPFVLTHLLKREEKLRFTCYFEKKFFQSIVHDSW